MRQLTWRWFLGGLVLASGAWLLAGCEDELPELEASALTCSDRRDNDIDGLVDCEDPECGTFSVCQSCSGAQCDPVQSDSCSGVTCDLPPNVCYKPAGSCIEGSCSYEADDGAGCDDGDPCTTDDSCLAGVCAGRPLSCDSPPATRCSDASTLLAFEPQGACARGQCSYEEKAVSCAHGCDAQNARCNGDPCSGVTCDQPPTICHKAVGLCAQGLCRYLFDDGATCDDGDACTVGDSCESGICGGAPKPCDTPPASHCKDATTLISYAAQGSCSNGQCDYAAREVTCTHGCDQAVNACAGDPCAGVICDDPPLDCYEAVGECRDGNCHYTPLDGTGCDDGDPCTVEDRCRGGSCRGAPMVCASPPKNVCKSDVLLTVYGSPGRCEGGQCNYPTRDTSCEFGCEAGACNGDPCAGVTCDAPPNDQCYAPEGVCADGQCNYVTTGGTRCDDGDPCTVNDLCSGPNCGGEPMTCTTPPRSFCRDARTLVIYTRQGSCSAGQCSYPSKDVICSFGCEAGACNGDPCADVVCETPPASYCKDEKTRVVFGSPGKCSGGECSYPSREQVCTYGCDKQSGSCITDPCANVTCDTPPDPVCVDEKTSLVYGSPGKCSGGECSYPARQTACSYGCNSATGLCNPDPCANVSCTTPPAPYCKDRVTRVYYDRLGKCSGGQCYYGAHAQTCDRPPADYCKDAYNLVVYSKQGSCLRGSCNYASKLVNCPEGCRDGLCYVM